VTEQLAVAKVGTRVVTYHGFGAPLPTGYALTTEEACGTDRLQLWIKELHVERPRSSST